MVQSSVADFVEMATGNEDANRRMVEIRAAKSRGDTDYLIRSLTDPDNRRFAARYLGSLGVQEAATKIAPLLYATNLHDRISAIRALPDLRYTAAIPRLIELATTDPECRPGLGGVHSRSIHRQEHHPRFCSGCYSTGSRVCSWSPGPSPTDFGRGTERGWTPRGVAPG
jgi:hypothetical protein